MHLSLAEPRAFDRVGELAAVRPIVLPRSKAEVTDGLLAALVQRSHGCARDFEPIGVDDRGLHERRVGELHSACSA